MPVQPSASYRMIMRCEIAKQPGMLGKVTSAIGDAGGDIEAIDLVSVDRKVTVRDIAIDASNDAHEQAIVQKVRQVPGVRVLDVSDHTFRVHAGGKIEVRSRLPIRTHDDLSMVYTPGVARVCRAIAENPLRVHALTSKHNMVAVVTDGSAVLGLGDIGPEASLPVMEGKCAIFKEFAGVDAFPIALRCRNVEEIVNCVACIATGFGGINLEDISAPRCFAIEPQLQAAVDIPVFHDDQHGTAIVVLAALINAARLVGKRLADVKVVVSGAGAAGVATARILKVAGAPHIVVCDRQGAIYAGRPAGMNAVKEQLAHETNLTGERGSLKEVVRGADVFIGVSSANLLHAEDVRAMAPDPIVFALANPTPEILPEDIQGLAAVIATGRSDYPNQINNALAFPGIFRGLLDCYACRVNEEMKMAAAHAIAGVVVADELHDDYIVPSIFNKQVVGEVASAVAQAARASGVARQPDPNLPLGSAVDGETTGPSACGCP